MAVLNSAPSPKRFAQAFGQEFGKAVKDAAGRDGRLSKNEAEKIAEPFRDNAVNYLEATGQKSVSVNKLIGAAERYAFVHADRASGGDGRVSLKDGEQLTGDLRTDFFLMRGKAIGGAGADKAKTPDERLAGFEKHYSAYNEDTDEGWNDYDFPRSMVVADFSAAGPHDTSVVPAGSDMEKFLAREAGEREGVTTYDTLQILKNPEDKSLALYFSENGETFQKLWVFDDLGALQGINKHYDDGTGDWSLAADIAPADRHDFTW